MIIVLGVFLFFLITGFGTIARAQSKTINMKLA